MPALQSRSKGWLVLSILIVAGGLAYRYRPLPVPISPDAVRRPVLAVLIFDNLSRDPGMDFLANALTGETNASLGQLSRGNFDVISQHTMLSYRKTRKTLHQIGRELDADYLLQGGVRKTGDQLHLVAELIRVSDQAKLWTEVYDRPFAETAGMQSSLIAKISASFNLQIDPAAAAAVDRAATQDPAALEAYFRGVALCSSGIETDLKGCIACLEAALKADPVYPRAQVALAAAQLRGDGDRRVAEKRLRQALEVSDAIPQAHVALGDMLGEEQEFKKAVALNPSDAFACLQYAAFLLSRDRPHEATVLVQRALELDPVSVDASVMAGRISVAEKFYDRGIAQLEKAVGMDRNNPDIRFYLGVAYLARAQQDDAIREFSRAVSFGPGVPEYIAALGEAYAAAKRYDEARIQLLQLKALSRTRRVDPALIEKLTQHIVPS